MPSNSQNVITVVKRRKSNLIKVFGERCCLCGFNAYQEALEFHHVNPEEFMLDIYKFLKIGKAIIMRRQLIN